MERLRRAGNLKNFWCSIIKEREKTRELLAYETKKNRILLELSEVDNDIITKRTEIEKISNEWQSEESLDLSLEIDADVSEMDLSFSHASGSGSKFSQLGEQSEITIEDPEDEVRSPGNIVGEDFNGTIDNEISISTAVGDDFNGEIGEEPSEGDNNFPTVGDDFNGEIGEDPNEGDNNVSTNTAVGGSVFKNIRQKNKRKRSILPLTPAREVNPRNKKRVNYNLGSPSRKRRKKPVLQSSPPPQSPLSQISLPPLSPAPSLPICLKCPQHCF
ncbi:8700_t:CDS:2 [Acaulospora morrowiae]|uniref:8700_t:CDS:1 n=1 Tax=Acaulospora morrowiae TaxID=94023 RepID=A0A9N9DQK2_9GLOM|nr:8700_t:CDS:2 [Acaulospora morrowiae]